MTMSRMLLAILLAAATVPAAAAPPAVLRWPGPAPCNTTLQACIDAAVAGDTIELATATPIDESPLVQKSLRLAKAPGHPVRFAATRRVTLHVPESSSESAVRFEVEGLRFERGAIQASHAGDKPVLVLLRGNRFDGPPAGVSAAILLLQDGSGPGMEFEVSGNRLDLRGEGSNHSGIAVEGNGAGEVLGRISQNRIRLGPIPAPRAGIRLYRPSRPLGVAVHGNRIDGEGFAVGIGAWRDPAAAGTSLQLLFVHSNAISGQRGSGGLAAAISLSAADLGLLASVFNNTVVHSDRGLLGLVDAGTLLLGIDNNLFAYNGVDAEIVEEATFDARNNLSHGNAETRLAGTSGLVTAAPRLGFDGIRLQPGSPAIDATSNPPGLSGYSPLDLDGLARTKGAALDIGAHEYGAQHLLHVSAATGTSVSALQEPGLNARPTAHPLFTHNWNPPGRSGVYVDRALSIEHTGVQWQLVDDGGFVFVPGAAFNVFAPGTAPRGHLSTGSNTLDETSVIDDPDLNEAPDLLLLAAHQRGGHGAGASLPVLPRFGVGRGSGRWNIIANSSLPTPRGYTLYAQPQSPNAFVHTAAPGNIILNWSVIEHPDLDGRHCARLQVTPRMDGTLPPGRLGVWYDGDRWAVYTENQVAMPVGVRVHVLFDPAQVEACSRNDVFRDGVEHVPYRARS
jgi:hypothetical protein